MNTMTTTTRTARIKLYGTPTTEELRKKHSFRLVGGMEMGRWDKEDTWQGSSWWAGWSCICMQINWEEQLGLENDHETQDSSVGK